MVRAMAVPASVFLLATGRTGGEDMGGESRGGCAATNSGASGSLRPDASGAAWAAGWHSGLATGLGVRTSEPSTSSGGVRGSGDASKPGGLREGLMPTMAFGTRRASANLAPSEEGAPDESSSGSAPSSSVATISSSCPLPLAVGNEGMMEVGDDGGSSVVGGVRAARERRLAGRGNVERALDLPCQRGGPSKTASSASPELRPNPQSRGMPSLGQPGAWLPCPSASEELESHAMMAKLFSAASSNNT